MRPQPLICVRDVEASSRWYQRLLHCESAHGGPNYERLVYAGKLVMQLHRWEVEHHHGPIGDPSDMNAIVKPMASSDPINWAALREEFPVTRNWAFFDHAAVAPSGG